MIGIGLCWKSLRARRKKHEERPAPPVVCVCQINSLVGVVLRENYDRASKEFWSSYRRGMRYPVGETPLGQRLWAPHTYVFSKDSRALQAILKGCFAEIATFEVSARPDQQNDGKAAYQHFFGRQPHPWEDIYWAAHSTTSSARTFHVRAAFFFIEKIILSF